MAWAALTSSMPASVVSQRNRVGNVLNASYTEIFGTHGRLVSLDAPAYVKSSTSGYATQAKQAKAALGGLLNQAFSVVSVHPWLQLVGDGEGHYRTLSPKKAAECLAVKLADRQDKQMPIGSFEAVALLISSDQMTSFASAISAFQAFFNVPDLRVAEHRAKQLATLETEKWEQPQPAKQSHWHEHRGDQCAPGDALHGETERLVSLAEGFDSENTSPIDELADLIIKKREYLQWLNADWNALDALLNGGFDGATAQGMFASGSASQIASALSAPNFQKHSLCVGVLFVGEDLTLIRELFGL